MSGKVSATQIAYEVASDALQLLGCNGLTKEYTLEKILRDSRASLVVDDCNEVLAVKGGYCLIDSNKLIGA